ncbi:protein kinase, partial [Candidatus Woesearchaeota archaeon]|nr:protein kinase [Candidatus Woesearchaeota archaeon]
SKEPGYSLPNILSRAIVVGGYYYDLKEKRIVNDPAFGESFENVREAQTYFKTCSDRDIEKIVNQMAVRLFPRKGQMVAIKLSLKSEDKRFRKEKRIAPLNLLKEKGSENVVAYYEYGTIHKEFQYHVTECVLNTFPFRELPLFEQKLKAFRFALLGVEFIHKFGEIVHRDIKPENILVTIVPDESFRAYHDACCQEQKYMLEIGNLKMQLDDLESYKQQDSHKYKILNKKMQEYADKIEEQRRRQKELPKSFKVSSAQVSDFGLAKFLGSDLKPSSSSKMTQDGAVIGTPFYMPPEQVGVGTGGNPHTDFTSDTYSLGCTLYEIISGVSPYRDKAGRGDFVSFVQIIDDSRKKKPVKPTHPRKLNKNADPLLIKVCSKALHREMVKRYKSVSGMIGDLDKWYEFQAKSARGKVWAKIKSFFGLSIIPGKDYSSQVFG